MEPVGFNEKDRFLKRFIACNFLSSRDNEKLKTPLYFSGQDASKYVSGDLEKSILGLTPGQDSWPWHIMFKFCDPTENTSDRNLKSVFPLTEVCGTRIQQAPHANKKSVFSALSP